MISVRLMGMVSVISALALIACTSPSVTSGVSDLGAIPSEVTDVQTPLSGKVVSPVGVASESEVAKSPTESARIVPLPRVVEGDAVLTRHKEVAEEVLPVLTSFEVSAVSRPVTVEVSLRDLGYTLTQVPATPEIFLSRVQDGVATIVQAVTPKVGASTVQLTLERDGVYRVLTSRDIVIPSSFKFPLVERYLGVNPTPVPTPYFDDWGEWQEEDGRTPVIFIHGAGSEHKKATQYRWGNLLTWIRAHDPDFEKTYRPVLFTYNSQLAIYGNALKLKEFIKEQCGTRRYLIVAHSMGGLVARSACAISPFDPNCLGMITLGTPFHGSPLAIPEWVRISFEEQELGGLKYALYISQLYNQLGGLFGVQGKSVAEMVRNFRGNQMSEGPRDLAYDNGSQVIPTVTTLRYAIFGPQDTWLSPDFAKQSFCLSFGQYGKENPIGYGAQISLQPGMQAVCRLNYLSNLHEMERWQVARRDPYISAYAGYMPSYAKNHATAEAFVALASRSMEDVVNDRGSDLEDRALAWMADTMSAMPINAHPVHRDALYGELVRDREGIFLGNDGLVSLDSALDHHYDVVPRVSRTRTGEVSVDTQSLGLYKGPLIARTTTLPYNHREIVEGKEKDDPLFAMIVADIRRIDAERAEERVRDAVWTQDDVSRVAVLLKAQYGYDRVTGLAPFAWMGTMVAVDGVVTARYGDSWRFRVWLEKRRGQWVSLRIINLTANGW